MQVNLIHVIAIEPCSTAILSYHAILSVIFKPSFVILQVYFLSLSTLHVRP
jgi:hypothetical protein